MVVHTDCRFYRGDLPCAPHKNEGVHCESCSYYEPFKEQILIIKLGAIGDVIRSTPLLQKLNEKFPSAKIHWLTQTPEVVPSSVDHVYRFIPEDVEILKAISFDFL